MSTGGQKLRMRTGCLPVNIGDVYSSPAYLGQHKAALVSGPSDRTVPYPRNVPWKVVAVIYPLGQSPGLSSLTLSKKTRRDTLIGAEVTVIHVPLGSWD